MTYITQKQFEMSDDAFRRITQLAYQEAGLHLPETKRAFIYSRLQKRLRKLKLTNFESYVLLLEGKEPDSKSERIQLISALTTNVTQFFREEHHFKILQDELTPILVKRASEGHKIRLWSAGCSAGPEPFSMALTCLNAAPTLRNADFKVLATDIDPAILAKAQAAIFPNEAIPEHWKTQFKGYTTRHDETSFQFTEEIRNKVAFRRLNLLADWPFKGTFDAIFCRNVAIYFDTATQTKVFSRLGQRLHPHGRLFVGHSERAPVGAKPSFVSCGLTTYKLEASA